MDKPPQANDSEAQEYWYTGDGPTDDQRKRRRSGGTRKGSKMARFRAVRRGRRR